MPESILDSPDTVDLRTPGRSVVKGEIDVIVRVQDAWLRIAVVALLEREGYRITEVDRGRALVVCDDDYTSGSRVTRLIDDKAGTSQAAIHAVLAGDVGAVVSKTNPRHLPLALAAICEGMFVAPQRVLEAANSVPALTPYQARILNCVGDGMSNPQIAQQLHISVGIVKKTISELRRVFEANSRVELAMSAKEIGYRPKTR